MYQRTLLASAALSALTSYAYAQTGDKAIPTVVVTANPFGASEGDQILVPAKILSGDELRDKLGSSIGETLSNELGVSASGFGAGASRPIIRGLEGSRVKMLENGMAVSDVSGLSNDHAVSAEGATARQIEILRGPAALLYGSGAIGGLVNIVNERIPAALEAGPAGQAELRGASVDGLRNVSLSGDGTVGTIGLHADANYRRTDDYKIPGNSTLGVAGAPGGRLPNSFTRENSGGFGASHVAPWGHVGASVGLLESQYGIPTDEGASIDQSQKRYDIDSLVKAPLSGFETFKFKAGYTDYEHTELNGEHAPETLFTNRALEARWELTHKPFGGWHGTFGMQTENTHFSALSAEGEALDTVPATHSTSSALFLVEETDVGPVRMNAGLRLEQVKRRPAARDARKFDLASYSVGGLWPFAPGYGFGATLSIAQRAPATEELYSGGAHEATATFDIGNPNFNKETSRNIELTVQKTGGLLRWKANLFENHVRDFVYGHITGNRFDEEGNPGDELRERVFMQADATIRGAEAEIGYNQRGHGLSARAFADLSHGKLDDGSSLPLQPARRAGFDVAYKEGALRGGLSLVHAFKQDRLATSETSATASYTQLNANVSYTVRYGKHDVTWFALAKNLLDEEIRLSTSVLKDSAPLPGRNFVLGVRTKF